jgi:hypothetical protein
MPLTAFLKAGFVARFLAVNTNSGPMINAFISGVQETFNPSI